MNNQKGFTLIELLVVVLIIGILAAMAMPQYFKAVERSRMTEAVTLLGNIAQAQQRKFMQINKFTENYKALDVAPKGATGASYYTKGETGNGFAVVLHGTTGYTNGYVEAERKNGNNSLQYAYKLKRYYASTNTSCIPQGAAGSEALSNAQGLCADYCGIDTVTSACCSDGSGTGAAECAAPTDGNN
ncbi:type IV pilin protein [Candidatus Avelusimicrobium caledoniensis]|uniref:type IV pilin protein n=1 Tax=Candidatus Avelusimicrobium caledoniensis TaxID=3416220 RepID=UPI003D12DF0C